MKQLLIIVALAVGVGGCFPLYVLEAMRLNVEAKRAYAAYCQDHMQECVDAYNRSPHYYGGGSQVCTGAGSSAGGVGTYAGTCAGGW
jgi:hypothetical protein